jgi:Eukaryotic protein of unknown function (DUF846)
MNGNLDGQITQQEPTILSQSSHPTALIFMILFRSSAIFLYLFQSFISTDFVLILVLIILSLAFDFWTVKNVSGRLLVGLRWWNEIGEGGESKWIFESREVSRSHCYK